MTSSLLSNCYVTCMLCYVTFRYVMLCYVTLCYLMLCLLCFLGESFLCGQCYVTKSSSFFLGDEFYADTGVGFNDIRW